MKIFDVREDREYRFSVFTSTYNRASLLKNVYNDLLNQTFKDFEWLVVNDGSSDETDSVIKGFIAERKIPILYISKENGGKHSAWKIATSFFHGKYEVGADDDDFVTSDMLEVFDREWKKLEEDDKYNEFWEIRARVARPDGSLVGPMFDRDFDSDYNEFCYKMHYGPVELEGCRKVSVLKKEAAVPNDILFSDKISNYSEGLRWSKAARKYKTRFIRNIVRIYNDTPHSLCKQKPSKRKFFTGLVNSIYTINEQRDLMIRFSRKSLLLNYLNVAYQSIRARCFILYPLKSRIDKVAVCAMYPIASIIYLFRK